MASSNRDSSNSDDEVVVKKRRYNRRNIVNSDSSDSEVEIRPITRLSTRQICDSESSADDECERNASSHNESGKWSTSEKTKGLHDSSDGEQCEKCSICLNKFLGQDTANPVTCDHTFCSECLQKWAKKINTCPIDRLKFNKILVRRYNESVAYRTISIENGLGIMDNDSDSSDTINCVLCGHSTNQRTIIVCDQCNLVYHRECINTQFLNSSVSSPQWCPICAPYVHIRDRMMRDFQELVQRRFRPAPYTPLNLSGSSVATSSNSPLQQTSILNGYESDSSLSDDSDDDSSLAQTTSRRRCCQEIRNRRQNRHVYAQMCGSSAVPQAEGFFSTTLTDGDEDDYEFNYGVLSRVHRRSFERVKMFMHSTSIPRRVPPPVPCTASSDLVGDILQLQTVLHTPGAVVQGNGSTSHSLSPEVQQCPLNPSPNTPSKCNNDQSQQSQTFASSSSGSGTSQYRDLYNLPGCSMVQSSSNADGYDTDSSSMITHRSYSIPEESKREEESSHTKDHSKTQSDDEVDIYSDIELTNEDETSVDAEMQVLNMGYKSDDCHLATTSTAAASSATVADGTDSSDNDLVIDEDMHVDDEREKSKSSSKPVDAVIGDNSDMEESGGRNDTVESIQSPDAQDDSQNSNNNFQSYNDSCGSYKFAEVGKMEEESKDLYVDSDSRDNNSTGNEADEENSTHSLQVDGYQNNSSNDASNQKLSFSMKITTCNETYHSDSPAVVDDDQKNSDVLDSESETNAGRNTSENEQESNIYDPCDSADKIGDCEDSNCSTSSKAEKQDERTEMETSQDAANVSKLIDGEEESHYNEQNVPSPCDNVCSNEGFESNEEVEKETKLLSPIQDAAKNTEDNRIEDLDEDCISNIDHATTEKPEIDDQNSCDHQIDGENSQALLSNGNAPHDQEAKVEHEAISPTFQGMDDLGIEDISDAASDDLNQQDSSTDGDQAAAATAAAVEKNVAQLFDQDSIEEQKLQSQEESHTSGLEDRKRFSSSSRQSLQDDQEEGEIIDDLPYRKKDSRKGYHTHDEDDFMDSAPRVNISDLPRIPKIKRDSNKTKEVEDVPMEVKRTSVLGRVDLGSSDISWKRLSQHTRERSYRDGRPKDESVLFRDRELRQKERRNKNALQERKGDTKHRESDKSKKEEAKKVETSKSKDRSSKDHRLERSKSEHEKSSKSYSTSEKRDKDKRKSHERTKTDKHDRSQSKSERDNKKDKREKYKEKSSRDHDKYERDKGRTEEKYRWEVERYENAEEQQYERSYEKSREKEYKHKHKEHRDHKSDNKKVKEEKKKRNHSNDQHSEKQKDREVRKIDDKLKIVVEHKKEKIEKHMEKKHEKKHRENIHHHHETKKKELIASPFSDTTPTPIESKEIFTKGDSIIINVNFNRNRDKDPGASIADDGIARDKKMHKFDSSFMDENGRFKNEKDSSFAESVGIKGPSTPDGRTEKPTSLSIGESYWQETDDMDTNNSPTADKCSIDKNSTDKDDASPMENYGADDMSDSDDNTETQQKSDENFSEMPTSEKTSTDSLYLENKDSDSFGGSRRRSPHPPSPPSPVDNDSYDPCEPTRSPSLPDSPPPPLPSKAMPDHPKPPPSPELPPLPPGPEPTDILPCEDLRSMKATTNQSPNKESSSTSTTSQPPVPYSQMTSTDANVSIPNVLMPPPSFPPRSSAIQSQMLPPKAVSWQVQNPPPTPLIFQPNHVQPIIRGNFLPSHIPTMGMPPQNVSTSMLPPTNSVPLMSQVRHLQQLSSHGVVPNNPLLHGVPMNISQLQLPHMNHPVTNSMVQLQNHPNSLSAQGSSVVRLMSVHNQLPNMAVTMQNQHIANIIHNQNLGHFLAPHSQMQTQASMMGQKSDKLLRDSPVKEKSEVVDMDVDSPYSPGYSPSIDSNYDYSPPMSPGQKISPTVSHSKDPFDNLVTTDKATSSAESNNKATPSKSSNKNRLSTNCADTPSKKAKLESRSESSSKSHHSVRLQVTEKGKSHKDRKLSDKKDFYTKMDDTQLKILDDLPSSAVEMQVKEKFLKKLNRQERVIEEVKLVLKPYYKSREVNKEEYKDILRKSVPKICHNKSGEINPVKVKNLVESYVKKVKHSRRKAKHSKSSKLS